MAPHPIVSLSGDDTEKESVCDAVTCSKESVFDHLPHSWPRAPKSLRMAPRHDSDIHGKPGPCAASSVLAARGLPSATHAIPVTAKEVRGSILILIVHTGTLRLGNIECLAGVPQLGRRRGAGAGGDGALGRTPCRTCGGPALPPIPAPHPTSTVVISLLQRQSCPLWAPSCSMAG